jgi:hypothetical protein
MIRIVVMTIAAATIGILEKTGDSMGATQAVDGFNDPVLGDFDIPWGGSLSLDDIVDSTTPTQQHGILVCRAADELVIYDPVTSRAASLSPSACAIWELCDGIRTIHDICKALGESFIAPTESLYADTRRTVGCLRDLGLLRL